MSKIEVDEVVNQTGDNDSGLDLSTNDVVKVKTANTERMRIDASGNVGIGTSSPDRLIHLAASDGNLARFQRTGSFTGSWDVLLGSLTTGDFTIYDNENSKRALQIDKLSGSSANPAVKIDDDGNLGVGVTSMNGVNRIYSAGSYSATTGLGANMVIESNGLISRSTSSQRYKNTIADATHGLAELMKLRPVTYKHNSNGDTVFSGLIAEEVHDAGLTEFVQYDDDNRPDALAYGNMIALCIKAVQELKTELDNAKARIAKLEAK